MAARKVDYEDYSHPEKIYKGLIFEETQLALTEPYKERHDRKVPPFDLDLQNTELCWVCGWTLWHQVWGGYGSRIRIQSVKRQKALWSLGSRWMVRDQPNDASLGYDLMTQNFLRKQVGLNIPLLPEMRLLSAPEDKVCLTLMSRAQGVELHSVWGSITPEQQKNYQDQLRDIVKELRKFTSTTPQTVNGGILDDTVVSNCPQRKHPTCVKIGRTTDEWFENISKELRYGISKLHKTRDPAIIDAKFQELKDNFPRPEPYVLTHCDFNFTNIFVNNDKIEAIIDWEYGGYYPWWVERWFTLHTEGAMDIFPDIWEELGDLSQRQFFEEVYKPVNQVVKTYHHGTLHLQGQHPKRDAAWLTPGFCECKPYGGRFLLNWLGDQPKHEMKDEYIV